MKNKASPDLSVTMAGVHFRSPIGVGPISFPWGKHTNKEPELHADVLLKHVKAGAGYICLTAMFLTEPTIKKLREIDAGIGSDLEEEQVDRYETTINRVKAFDDAEFATKLEQAIEGLKPR